jgi:HEAT repeat protein
MEAHLSKQEEATLELLIEAFAENTDEDIYYYNASERRAALRAITSVVGEQGIEMATCLLLAGLSHESLKIRAGCAHLLGKLGETRATEPLLTLLTSPALRKQIRQAEEQDIRARSLLNNSSRLARGYLYNEVLVHTIRALGRLREPRALGPLITLLHQYDDFPPLSDYGPVSGTQDLPTLRAQHAAEIRASAVLALGMFRGDPRATSALIEHLPHETALQVRFDICYALEELMDPRAIPVLIQELVGTTDPDDEPEEQHSIELTMSDLLRPLSPDERQPYTDLLIPILTDPFPTRRMRVATILGEAQEVRALPALLTLLEDEYQMVRERAIEALGKLGNQEVIAPLYDALLQEKDPFFGRVIVTALCRLHDRRVYREVFLALESRHPGTRLWGVQSLGYFGDPQAIDALRALAHDEDWSVCNALPDALCSIDPERAVQIFLEILSHREEYQIEERHKESHSKPQKMLYWPSTHQLMKKIIRFLAQHQDIRALGPLTTLLAENDDELRPDVMRAIKKLHAKRDEEKQFLSREQSKETEEYK